MFETHEVFNTPGPNASIWRYMDFTKFVSLLDRKALFFCRAHLLGDPFEGTRGRASSEAFEAHLSGKPTPWKDELRANQPTITQNIQRTTLINSWHLGEYESAAMWRLYLQAEEGIAVRTTIGGLCRSLEAFPEPVYVGAVSYIDYDRTPIPAGNVFWPFVHKRQSFEHEREARAVIARWNFPKGLVQLAEVEDAGEHVPVLLDHLIERVYVAPTSPDWFLDLVESVVEVYGYEFPIERSVLGDDPIF